MSPENPYQGSQSMRNAEKHAKEWMLLEEKITRSSLEDPEDPEEIISECC
jgi:hypothetical protein